MFGFFKKKYDHSHNEYDLKIEKVDTRSAKYMLYPLNNGCRYYDEICIEIMEYIFSTRTSITFIEIWSDADHAIKCLNSYYNELQVYKINNIFMGYNSIISITDNFNTHIIKYFFEKAVYEIALNLYSSENLSNYHNFNEIYNDIQNNKFDVHVEFQRCPDILTIVINQNFDLISVIKEVCNKYNRVLRINGEVSL